MYNPPTEANWYDAGEFDESYAKAYQKGYQIAEAGGIIQDCPYTPSGHPRDTTFEDELHYWWNHGYDDFRY